MKKVYLSVLFFLTVYVCSFSQQQSQKLYGKQAYFMMKVLDKYHYQPATVNDELSVQLYKHFLKELDPFGVYFTENEIKKLSEWKTKLDDEINTQSTVFVEQTAAMYRQRLLMADTIIGELLSKPMNFSVPDSLRFYDESPDEIEYVKDEVALKKRWNKWLKYQVLAVMFSAEDEGEDLFTADVKTILAKEPEARKKVLVRNKRSIKRKLNAPEGFEDHVASVFLNSFTYCYDPHTEFFSPSDEQQFEESLSADEYALGINLDENDKGEVEISRLQPGGSAWKSNQLHVGDVLLQVKRSGSPAIDLSSSTLEEAEDIIGAITSKEVELTVRTTSGQVKKVSLIKTKIRSDDNIVKSFILDGEKKIGYISLPSFYTDWESRTHLGCANDVAKEIVKLQEEKMDGLILDLRYNGGGSVEEAISLAGIFIDEGPLCIYRSRNEKPHLLKDINRGTAYNGPFLVMVNGLSASASELFSAAMQDYRRALIAGSTTYGKATGQIICPIDTAYSIEQIRSGESMVKENKLGYVKVTMEKYYRVTNSTCQMQGVVPDVFLPYPYVYDDYRESKCETALIKDTVIKKVIYNPLPALPVKQMADQSAVRVKKNTNYQRMKQVNDSLRAIEKEEKPVPLNPQQFGRSEKSRYRLESSMDDAMTDSTASLKVMNNKYDQKVNEMDTESKEINEIILRNISRDIYIQECYRVITDLINFDKK